MIYNFCANALKNKSICSFFIVKGGKIRIRFGFLELPVNKKQSKSHFFRRVATGKSNSNPSIKPRPLSCFSFGTDLAFSIK